ncbi:GNAT family N-acetyltransferase [Magnetovirga frankeli]|uniref:GNAT family N-acetyltransferase n=1 Tax=Magnetovirga frankeli TaxID=947516 RepID=UPI0012930C78|nr:GNAT family N-acetyltransferase [gamma proteobacterium SS-5]
MTQQTLSMSVAQFEAYVVRALNAAIAKRDLASARLALQQGLEKVPGSRVLRDWAFLLNPAWQDTVQAKNVRLRPPNASDADYVFGCFTDQAFMRLYNPARLATPPSREQIAKALANASFSLVNSRSTDWIIEKRATIPGSSQPIFEPVGLANLTNIVAGHRRAEYLMGILSPEDRGAGIAITTSLLIFDLVFNRLGCHKLSVVVMKDNRLSQDTCLSLGFVEEGVRRSHVLHPLDGNWIDCCDSAMLESDFRGNSRLARLSRRLLGRDVTG